MNNRKKAIFLLAAIALASNCEAKAAFRPQSALTPMKENVSTSTASTSIKKKITDIQGGAEDGKSSLSTAMFNLVKGIVGAGVLSLPAGKIAQVSLSSPFENVKKG